MSMIPSLFNPKAAAAAAPVAPVAAVQATAPNTGSASYPAGFGANVTPAPANQVNPEDIITVAQNPLKTFQGDIVIPGAGAITTIDIWTQIGSNCVGFNLLNLSLPALVNINGGGWRTVPSDMVVDESIINSLAIQNFGTNAVLQLNGA